MNDDTLDLLAKLDDDALAPEEHARLLATLKADPEARRTLVMHYMIGAGTSRLARAKSARRARSNRLVFPLRRLLQSVLAAAAALLIAAGIWIANRQRPDFGPATVAGLTETVLRVTEAEGGLVLVRDGQSAPVKPGVRMRQGDILHVLAASRAVLRLEEPEGATALLELTSDANMTFSSAARHIRLRLETGRIEAQVARRVSGRTFSVQTPHADISVLGTRFTVVSESEATRTRVEDGRIALTRLSDRQTIGVEAGRYAVATSDTDPIPQGVFTPNLAVEQGLLFSETFGQGWNPDLWETRYYDSRAGESFAKDLYGSLVTIVPATPTSGTARRLDLKAPSRSGDRTLLRPRPERIRFPNAFVLEYELEHVQPSQFGLIGLGSIVKHLYTHPQAETLIDQATGHGRGAIHASIRFVQSRSATGTWIVEGVEYINGIKRQHSLLESDIPPTFAYFSLTDGHVRLANIVARELVPFEPENLAGPRLYFRETFEQGWRPHLWETGYYDNQANQSVRKEMFGTNIALTEYTRDSKRARALEMRELGKTGNQVLLRAVPGLLRIPAAFSLGFDVFHAEPSEFSYMDLGGQGVILYQDPDATRKRTRMMRRKEWWRTRIDMRLHRDENGALVADSEEYLNEELVTRTRYAGIREPAADVPPDLLFYSLKSGRVLLDNIVVREWRPPDATLVQADRETTADH